MSVEPLLQRVENIWVDVEILDTYKGERERERDVICKYYNKYIYGTGLQPRPPRDGDGS